MFKIRLKQYRIKNGYTQKVMADFIGVPLSTYKSWEYGTALPSYPARELIKERFPDLDPLWQREKMAK